MDFPTAAHLNRRLRRTINAEDRRASRSALGGCTSCGPSNGFGKYTGVVSSMGRMFGNNEVVKAAHTEENAPMVGAAARLASVTAAVLEDLPPANRLTALARATNPQFAAEVNALAAKMPQSMWPSERLRFALMVMLIPGCGEASLGMGSHRSDAYAKLDAGLQMASDRLKTKGQNLSGLGAATLVNETNLTCSPFDTYGGWLESSKVDVGKQKFRARYRVEAHPLFIEAVKARNPCKDSHYDDLLNRYPPPPPVTATPGCREPLKTGDDWIVEDCEANATAAGDAEARARKIEMVKAAFVAATGKSPDNCAINYYTAMRWCSVGTYTAKILENEPRRLSGQPQKPEDTAARNIITNIADKAKQASDFFSSVGDKLVGYILDGAEAASAAFCKGFKALMGDTVGGIFCTLFDVLFKLISGTLRAAFTIVVQALKAVVDFIQKLFSGDFIGAIMVLFQRINTIILLAIGAPLADLLGIPMTRGDALKLGKDPDTSFEGLGERLTTKDPLFTVNLAIAIVNVVLAATATGLTAGAAVIALRLAVGGLVFVLADAVAIVYAPQLMKLSAFADVAKEKVEKGISMFVRLSALVVQAILTITDMVKKIQTSVDKWVENMKYKVGAAGGVSNLLKFGAEDIWKTVKDKVSAIWANVKWPIKFSEIGSMITELVKALPLMLLAVVDDGEGTLKDITPQLTSIYGQIAKNWQQAKDQWEVISQNLTPEERARAIAADVDPIVAKARKEAETIASQAAERNAREEIQRLQAQLAATRRELELARKGLPPAPPQKASSGFGGIGIAAVAAVGLLAVMAPRRG